MTETTLQPRTLAPASPAIDLSADPAFGWLDLAVVAAVIGVALYYLYRKLWRRGGRCDGCGKAGCGAAARRSASAGGVRVPLDRRP